MTQLADTSSIRVKPIPFAVAAFFALSSTMPHNAGRPDFPRTRLYETTVSSTTNFDLGAFSSFSASTATRALTLNEVAESLKELLAKESIKISRVERTADQSILFQFLGETKACIDLYPNGDLIVVTRQPGRDEIHELRYGDSDRVIKLLQDAGVNS
jgi:hypothetical protein